MNNTQFRRLVLDTPNVKPNGNKEPLTSTPRRDGASQAALGSRMRSSIPMTPRSVAGSSSGIDFARQLAAHNAPPGHPAKRFKSSAAPKGSKLASGYVDRTQTRVSTEEDEMASRIKALEDMVKLGQIDEGTFVKLRDEIVGGDVGTTHLVKGLDWKLLERVRRGVDVLGGGESGVKEEEEGGQSGKGGEDVEEEFEKLEHREIKPVKKEEKVKKGGTAQAGVVAGKKRTRDEILAELRASRLAAAAEKKAAEKPLLGPKFRRLGDRKEKSRIERDGKGREVLITVDEEGRVKRKVKKSKVEEGTNSNGSRLLIPDKESKPLGMEVQGVPFSEPAEDEDDGDIFEGAGDDYDPLGGGDDDDDGDDSADSSVDDTKTSPIDSEPASTADIIGDNSEHGVLGHPVAPRKESTTDMPPPPPPQIPPVPIRNYFGDLTASEQDFNKPTPSNPLTDPTILAALKKASSIAPIASEDSRDANDEEAARLARRKKMLESHDRDAEDMDLGFGSSRFGDEEDTEERKVKLSVWAGGAEGGDDGSGKGDGKGKRKRGPKKRKGDGNNAADVLKVLERRKEGSK